MNEHEFEERLKELRPRLHRYCARMTGSAVDGEDVLQDTLVKALRARAAGVGVDSLEGWLFRIAHNASLDFLRHRSRSRVVPLTEYIEATGTGGAARFGPARLEPGNFEPAMYESVNPEPAVSGPADSESAESEPDIVAVGFRTFLQLPELQRCAVILKDVLGHSVEDIAGIADCTPAAAKSALQRGRVALRKLAQMPEDTRLPLMSDVDRQKMTAYVQLFRSGDFDAIRGMLAEDVKLELVNRLNLEGREKIERYFTRYAEETRWRFALGAVEGRPAMLVFDSTGPMERPAHFVLIDWRSERIVGIRDFLFAPYVLEVIDWGRLG